MRFEGRMLSRPRGLSRWAGAEDGATLVEMAIATTVLFAVIFGIIQFSFALYTYNYVSDAAREGARWAMVRGANCSINTKTLDHCGATIPDIQTYVRSLGYPGIDSANRMTVNTTWFAQTWDSNASTMTWAKCENQCNEQGNEVQVNVSYRFPLNIPFWKASTLNVQSTATMVISQ